MKKSNLLLLTAFAGILFVSSCKKKDDPAPVVVAPVASMGTFTVDGMVQVPSIYTKNAYPLPQPSTDKLTQIIYQNEKYGIKLEFNKAPLVDGQYTVENSPFAGMTVFITLTDMITKDTDLINTGKHFVTVTGQKITFSDIPANLNNKDIKISGNLTAK